MKDPDFSEFPILTTARLILRKVSLGDAQVIHQLRSDIEVVRLMGKKPFTTLDEAITYIKRIESLVSNNECIFWGISYGNSTELIGVICFWNFDILNETVEIGYELLPEFQGKGIMKEAIACLLEYGFDTMGARKIVAFPSVENPASVKLLEKSGFKLASANYQNSHTDIAGMLTYVIDVQ
jgi:ribosomal-protein-alanine N-acetyltransferase